MSKQNQHKPNVPELRFPEFIGEWEEFRLKDIALINDGTHTTPKYVEKGIPFFSVENVSRNDFVNCKYVTEEAYNRYNKRIKIEKDDILMTRIGSIGAVKLVDWSYKSTFYVSLALLKVFKNFISQFIVYLIESPSTQKNILRNSLVTAVPQKINLVDLKEVKVKLPINKKEQQKLGNFFSKLDRQIELEEKKLALLEEQKKGYMQKIFSQELRFKDKNGNEYPEWEEKKLIDIVDVRDGTHESPKPVDSGFKLVTSKNLKSGKLDLCDTYFISKEDFNKINERSLVESNDILFGMIGTIGNPVILENTGFAIKNVALIKTSKFPQPYFILAYLKSEYVNRYFHKYNTGGTQKFISLEAIRNIPIFFPSLKEQERISNLFKVMAQRNDEQKKRLNELIERKRILLRLMYL